VSRTCIVCGSSSHARYSEGVVKCKACGFVFADADLTEAELFKLYHRDYFFGEEYSNYLADQSVIQKNFKLRFLRALRVLRVSRLVTVPALSL
jgi:hypothetical protein